MSKFTHARYLTIGLALLTTSALSVVHPDEKAATPAAPVVLSADSDPAAKALLDATVAHYSALKNISVVCENTLGKQLVQYSGPKSISVTLLTSKGQMIRQQLYTPTSFSLLMNNKGTLEWYTRPLDPAPAGKDPRLAWTKMTFGGALFPSIMVGLDPFRAGAPFQASSYKMGEPSTEDGVEMNSVIVTCPRSEHFPLDMSFTINIGKNDHLVHSIKSVTTVPEGTKSQSITTSLGGAKNATITTAPGGTKSESVNKFTDIKTNAPLTDAAFEFTPPTGAVKIEVPTLPKVRAKVGEAPLPITTKDITGKDFSFDEYKGKVVLVDFWATWCGPCVAELPNVKANYAKYHDQGFDVVGISLDQTVDPLTKFIEQKQMPWRQIFDGYWTGPIATAYNVKAIPATILIGKDGKVAAIGARGEDLEPAIKAALEAK